MVFTFFEIYEYRFRSQYVVAIRKYHFSVVRLANMIARTIAAKPKPQLGLVAVALLSLWNGPDIWPSLKV